MENINLNKGRLTIRTLEQKKTNESRMSIDKRTIISIHRKDVYIEKENGEELFINLSENELPDLIDALEYCLRQIMKSK